MSRAALPSQTNKAIAMKPDERTTLQTDEESSGPTMLDAEKRESYLAELALEETPERQIGVQDGSIQSNLVQLTFEDLQKPLKKDQFFPTLSRKALDVRVSKAQAERAAKIMDALLAAFNSRNWKLELAMVEEKREMAVTVLGYKIVFWLEEILDRKRHELTPAEEKEKIKDPWKYYRPTWDYSPSGRLALKIGPLPSGYNSEYRETWADGRYQRVERQLSRFSKGLVLTAISRRNEEIRAAQRKCEQEERERKYQEEQRLLRIEETRRNRLSKALESFESMLLIQRYIEHVRESALRLEKPIEGDLANWIEWAETYAAKHDPLREGFPGYDIQPSYF